MVCKNSVRTILEPPSATQLEYIRTDTNEISEDKLLHSERLMHEWIRCQSHFPKDVDKGLIRAFIRGSKHNLDTAKRKLEHHLAARHLYPEVYGNRSPVSKEIVQAMDVVNMILLPKMTPKGYRLCCFSLNRYDPAEFSPFGTLKLFFMLYELILSADIPFAGDIAIFDASHFGAAHMTKWFGPFIKTLATLLREAYTIRLKQIHIINAPTMLAKMVNGIKPLMHPKVRESVYIHSNPKSLVDIFGPDILPSDYDGNLKSVRELATDWYDVLNENADWFETQENVKITGIPKKVKSNLYFTESLGVEGSFRKLEID